MEENKIEWRKFHRYMPHSGMCGSTTIWTILNACGIKRPLWFINYYVYKRWWGVCPQLFIAFLSRYFSIVNFKIGTNIRDISF